MNDISNIRKNILVDGMADKCIQNNRAKFLGRDTPVDIDYSKMASMLIEIGSATITKINEPEHSLDAPGGGSYTSTEDYLNIISEIINKYTGVTK